MCTLVVLALVVCLCSVLTWRLVLKQKKDIRLPPGPNGLPFIGCFLQLAKTPIHLLFDKWKEAYGPIMAVKIPFGHVVVFNTPEMIRSAFYDHRYAEVFAGRPDSFMGKYISYNDSALTFHTWDQSTPNMRRLEQKAIHIYGEGSETTQRIFQEEFSATVQHLLSLEGQSFVLYDEFNVFMAKVITILLKGQSFPHNHENIKAMIAFNIRVNRILEPRYLSLLTTFPFLRLIPGKFKDLYEETIKARDKFEEAFLGDSFETGGKEERGIGDWLSQTMNEIKSSQNPWFTQDHVRAFCMEMVGAGIVPTMSTICSLFLLLLHYPDVQRKVQEEIDNVIGRDRFPCVDDKPGMPFTNATILECFRLMTPNPVLIPRKCMKDVTFEGYFIRKGTEVFPNMWSIHHDKNVYEDPFEFRPSRYLGDDGKLLPLTDPKMKGNLNFGIGKRLCVGQNFAKTKIFLLLTTLLQSLTFLPAEDSKLPSIDPRKMIPGFLMMVPNYRCRVVPRETTW